MNRRLSISTPEDQTIPEAPALPKLPSGCSWQDDGSVRMLLKKALTKETSSPAGKHSEDISELVFRDLTAGDIIDSSGLLTGGKRTLFLMCASSGQSGPAGEMLLRSMAGSDYIKATRIIDVFTSDGPMTGTSA
ncbi:hypothetical protein Gbth_017_176 [Gluconobacter thailandicus F149-1 = NBRC 100600]|uniref:Uncharacterized protein n=1 Tax=Gluconobacter thailandicus NBRC 3257 TaxID=1381097 RepID=A0ABQ0IW83_GLUTH|nr:hypothetical protein [Gluconobacter thailandicus]KXV54148.1 hypothetical protein AD946_04225 [Gluconobacter thailandicus]GAC87867.1 hypothetical protein NBRC3255_1528 [Gluconobacter thailandicus NBRC 3255]GAD26464.1 hypothetical protein NBRC3257_1463 [Gluconobacter thailandicus NBRC 3257]GAN93001.1 hypothetical protein Gbth_017_176 [Gluconobacter thailandicus F149-1 = NBRC 100600]GBR61613.1 hypothetical protein AA100600_2951 [Gluconobacter thailandicus F149-1 = NBRC 100600]